MSSWISGKGLIERWNIKDIDFFDCLRMGLQPYSKFGKFFRCSEPYHEYYNLWRALEVTKRQLKEIDQLIHPFVSISDRPPPPRTDQEMKSKKIVKEENVKKKHQFEKQYYNDILARINTIFKVVAHSFSLIHHCPF